MPDVETSEQSPAPDVIREDLDDLNRRLADLRRNNQQELEMDIAALKQRLEQALVRLREKLLESADAGKSRKAG
jgi:hypothetical protein